MLGRMYEHALAIVPDGDRRLIPGEASVNVAMSPFDVSIVREILFDVLPISPGRNLSVSLDHVVGVPGRNMIEDRTLGGMSPHCLKEGVRPKLLTTWFIVFVFLHLLAVRYLR